MGPSLTRRDFSLVVLSLPAACAAESSSAQAPSRQPQPQRPSSPPRPEPLPARGPGDAAAIALTAAGTPPGTAVAFGHAFPPGAVPRDARLALRLPNERTLLPIDLRVLSRHRDGSVRTAILVIAPPALPRDRPLGALIAAEAAGRQL